MNGNDSVLYSWGSCNQSIHSAHQQSGFFHRQTYIMHTSGNHYTITYNSHHHVHSGVEFQIPTHIIFKTLSRPAVSLHVKENIPVLLNFSRPWDVRLLIFGNQRSPIKKYSMAPVVMWLRQAATSSLKLPEKYGKCLRHSSAVKGESLSKPPSGREWITRRRLT